MDRLKELYGPREANAILRLVIISLGNVVGGLILPAIKLLAKKCEA